MPIVAIVSQKGGSGKTTLAIHLAVRAVASGKLTYVIDTDPQATAAAWGDWRGDYQPEVITSPPARLTRTIQTLTKGGGEFIVIDTPPHADAAAREAVKAADLVLIPTRLRAFDLHAIEATAELVGFAGTPAFVLLNAVPARATRQVDAAIQAVDGYGLKVCPVRFGERAAFHQASATGEVAAEINVETKAAAEVEALWQWVGRQIGN